MTGKASMKDHEVFDNTVASVVDVTSIMVAYTIGITQSSIFLGLAYGVFDAIIVVWMRKPISKVIRRVMRVSPPKTTDEKYAPDISEKLTQW
jgi:hypothetical protein